MTTKKGQTTITILDFRNGKEEVVELKDICEGETQQLQAAMEKSYGIIYKIKRIVNPEIFVKTYYQKNGYRVIPGKDVQHILKHNEVGEKILKILKEKYNVDVEHETGCPDHFLYKEDSPDDCFYVEVKAGYDTLRPSQLRWISQNIAPIKVIYVTSDLEEKGRVKVRDDRLDDRIRPILMYIKELQDEGSELSRKGDWAGYNEISERLKEIKRWL